MKYNVSFNVCKGYVDVEVEANSKDEAEDLAWEEFVSKFVGELRKLEVDITAEEEE